MYLSFTLYYRLFLILVNKSYIYQMDYSQVLGFDCGSRGNVKFPEQEKIIARKPLLMEVIAAVEDHIKNHSAYEVDYNIEIK